MQLKILMSESGNHRNDDKTLRTNNCFPYMKPLVCSPINYERLSGQYPKYRKISKVLYNEYLIRTIR